MSKDEPHYGMGIGFGPESRVMPVSYPVTHDLSVPSHTTSGSCCADAPAESDADTATGYLCTTHGSSAQPCTCYPPAESNRHNPAECGICYAAVNPHTPADAITVRPSGRS